MIKINTMSENKSFGLHAACQPTNPVWIRLKPFILGVIFLWEDSQESPQLQSQM